MPDEPSAPRAPGSGGEALFRAIVDHTQFGVQVFRLADPDEPGSLTLEYVNPRMAEITGVDLSCFLGQRMDRFAPLSVEMGRAAGIAAVVRSGEPVVLGLVHYPGNVPVVGMKEAWVETRVFKAGPEHAGVMAEVVTDRVRAEQAQTRLLESLQQHNTELEQFAFIAPHDLQEPLRKVLAFGDRLARRERSGLSEQGRDDVDRMMSAARRMQQLIEDLLTLSRVGMRGSAFAEVSLDAVLADVRSDLEVQIAEGGARIEAEPLPVLAGDAAQLRQLFQNLLSNALKYRADGRPPVVHIHAEETRMADGTAGVKVQVRDNGIGFRPDQAEKIFEPFQRLHARSAYAGTGIGLTICRKIVARHHGQITAMAAPGEGATFSVVLPRAARADSAG
jgi:light-regulated signal transduction histidine kinase (bacteriophytochrome)